MIALVSSPRFIEHQTGHHHPERPDRIRAIHRALRRSGLLRSPDPFPEFEIDLGAMPQAGFEAVELEASAADPEAALLVHPQEHLDKIRHVCEVGGGVLDLGDTPVSRHSYDIALLSLGAALQACDLVMTGQARRAMAIARPPGHHAEPDRAMGFCLFSNIAIAARHIQRKYDVPRVAIVDFDVHHGNGTQAAFEADRSVYFVSLHQHPRTCYPGSGYEWEIGVGEGRGTTMNICFEPGADSDQYMEALRSRVLPALDAFNPGALLISAGFDAHMDDPLAEVNLTEQAFEEMTRELVRLAERHCAGQVISLLEGGYNLRALGRSVVRHIIGLGEGLNWCAGRGGRVEKRTAAGWETRGGVGLETVQLTAGGIRGGRSAR